MTTVLACLDDSIYTQSVIDHASWAALRANASLEFMHTIERHPERAQTSNLSGNIGLTTNEDLLEELATLDEQHGRLALKQGHALLAAATASASKQGVSVIHERLRHGDLIETLVEFQADYDLLVLGKRGESADMAKLHLGSSLERAVRSVHRPILVASRAFKPIERVLIAFDGSASARKAVELAAQSHLLAGLECHLLMVGTESPTQAAQMTWALELLDAAGIKVKAETIPGHADTVIVDYVRSHGIDLVTMGAYGHSRIRQLIVGSTTTTVVRSCLVPILLVR